MKLSDNKTLNIVCVVLVPTNLLTQQYFFKVLSAMSSLECDQTWQNFRHLVKI